MDWLNNLFKGKPTGAGDDKNVLWLYVRCDRCGSPLAVRVNKNNEMSPDYENGGYMLRKEMMDSKCFQLMYAELHFDEQGRETSREAEHATFITGDEYEAGKKDS